jgi:hypothetical protein
MSLTGIRRLFLSRPQRVLAHARGRNGVVSLHDCLHLKHPSLHIAIAIVNTNHQALTYPVILLHLRILFFHALTARAPSHASPRNKYADADADIPADRPDFLPHVLRVQISYFIASEPR